MIECRSGWRLDIRVSPARKSRVGCSPGEYGFGTPEATGICNDLSRSVDGEQIRAHLIRSFVRERVSNDLLHDHRRPPRLPSRPLIRLVFPRWRVHNGPDRLLDFHGVECDSRVSGDAESAYPKGFHFLGNRRRGRMQLERRQQDRDTRLAFSCTLKMHQCWVFQACLLDPPTQKDG